MRLILIVGALAALTACSDPIADAQEQLRIARHVGSRADRCRAARALSDAYLKAHREIDYGLASVDADLECNGSGQ